MREIIITEEKYSELKAYITALNQYIDLLKEEIEFYESEFNVPQRLKEKDKCCKDPEKDKWKAKDYEILLMNVKSDLKLHLIN